MQTYANTGGHHPEGHRRAAWRSSGSWPGPGAVRLLSHQGPTCSTNVFEADIFMELVLQEM